MRGLFQCFMHFKFLFFLPFALFLFGGSTDALPASFILAAGDRGVGGPGSRLGQETESGVRFPADCQLLAGTPAAGCRGHIQGSEGLCQGTSVSSLRPDAVESHGRGNFGLRELAFSGSCGRVGVPSVALSAC